MVFRLLAGTLSGSELETALTTNASAYLGPWREILKTTELNALLNSPTALAAIFASETAFDALLNSGDSGYALAASDSATLLISNTSAAAKTVVTNSAYLDFWWTVPANKTRLQNRINASGSKLKRQVWTSSGTWTAPGAPIVALSVFAVGKGGDGGVGGWDGGSTTGQPGAGGSGAESAAKSATTSLPTTNQTVTVSTTIVTPSSFGAFLTAACGVNGAQAGPPTTGGGSTVGTIYDADPTNAIWQPNTGSKQGGSGAFGGGGNSNNNGNAGSAGLTGSGGAGGTVIAGPAATAAGAGTGIGSGGGSGANIYPSGAAGVNGSSALSTNYGSGGGGGSGTASVANGGLGAPGLVVAYWVES